jgi:hypothetical protein
MQDMAKDCGMLKYYEVSAKTGDGVQEVFEAISKYERVRNKDPPPPPPEPEASTATTNERSKCNIC